MLEAKKAPGEAALALMENHLTSHIFLVAESFSIADIALYAYTHVAEEGGFALDGYPAIQAWIKRVENVPGFISIEGGKWGSGLGDVIKPVSEFLILSFYYGEIPFLESFCYFSGFSGTYLLAVNFLDRGYFGGGTSEKRLICDI